MHNEEDKQQDADSCQVMHVVSLGLLVCMQFTSRPVCAAEKE